MPLEKDDFVENLSKVESVHDNHLKEMRHHFTTQIKRLETKLVKSQSKLKRKEEILEKFKNELHIDSNKLNDSLMGLLNSSRNGPIAEHEAFHQEVICELEKQLNTMRMDCSKETQQVRDECNTELRTQKEKYEKLLEEIKD